MAEFVEKNPDDFPSPYVSVSPPASTSALGGLPDPSTTDDRRAVLTTYRCFLASPTGSPTPVNEAGTDYRIHYRIGKDLAADFNVEVVSVGVDVKASQRFVLALDDVRVQSADLLPIPGGDCGTFDNPDEVFVIFTKQVVAGKVLLSFGRKFDSEADARVALGEIAGVVEVEDGWSFVSGQGFRGRDIIIAAFPERWKVKRDEQLKLSLGPSPAPGRTFSLADDVLTLVVLGYDPLARQLSIRLDALLNVGGQVPLGVSDPESWIAAGKDVTLGLGEGKRLLFGSGGKVAVVRWTLEPIEGQPPDVQSIVVSVDVFGMVRDGGA